MESNRRFILAFNFHDPVVTHGWAMSNSSDSDFPSENYGQWDNSWSDDLDMFYGLGYLGGWGYHHYRPLYTSDLRWRPGVAATAIVALALLNIFNVRRTGIYILVGLVLWTAVLKSGIHATLAGVILGFIPLKEKDGVFHPAIDQCHSSGCPGSFCRCLLLPTPACHWRASR
jgi:NhaA family Na+:H+ antiporter